MVFTSTNNFGWNIKVDVINSIHVKAEKNLSKIKFWLLSLINKINLSKHILENDCKQAFESWTPSYLFCLQAALLNEKWAEFTIGPNFFFLYLIKVCMKHWVKDRHNIIWPLLPFLPRMLFLISLAYHLYWNATIQFSSRNSFGLTKKKKEERSALT